MLICYLLFRWSKKYLPEIKSYWLPLVYLVKIGFGLFFLWVYTYHYGGGQLSADAGQFFKESKILHAVSHVSFSDYLKFLTGNESNEMILHYLSETTHWDANSQTLFSDSQNVIRVNSIILFLSQGEILVHVLILCLLSLIGMLCIYQGIKRYTKISSTITFLIITLIPSVAFWSGSIIKEPMLILGLGLVFNALFGEHLLRKRIILATIATVFLIGFKPYVGICIFPALIFYFSSKIILPKRPIFTFTVMIGIGIVSILFTNFGQKVTNQISKRQLDFINVSEGGIHLFNENVFTVFPFEAKDKFFIREDYATLLEPTDGFLVTDNYSYEMTPQHFEPTGDSILIYYMSPGSGSGLNVSRVNFDRVQLVKNIPEAMFNSLFRPLPNDEGPWFKYLAMAENFILLFTLLFVLLFRSRKLNILEKRLVWSLVLFASVLALIIGWSTPVVGAIVRYKIPITIAIVLIIVILFKKKEHAR